ncbi:DUF4830 domain-containing protein [Metasolibacillus meyeri]|uniref:DUF4830 domain-containing protein n=1 Tax=Metasolibacillus meyeri TaxID=1071052 RepID=A0AAW9NQE2_9BACL|nr:hypothetical protein [Metasolibacillus meyeri]MEC1178235.1 DUF4830 domain-containing protein [Metasolibacillus meyeri]
MILVACTNENIDKEHLAYIENLGWTIKSFNASAQIVMEPALETVENYQSSNITFIGNYIGKELNITTYELKETSLEGENLRLNIYEYEGEIVGSIGEIPNYTPGIFNPSDKVKLQSVGVFLIPH